MSYEFKGTKENWNLTHPEGSNGFLYVGIYKGGEIATCYNFRGDEGYVTDETKANAKLISCAPEMFEMLKRLIDNSDVPNELYDEAKQLLKKATTI